MPQYKNISEKDLTLHGIDIVKAGEFIEQPDGFNNANFEKVGEAKSHQPETKPEKTQEQEQTKQVEENKKQTKEN